MPRSRSPRRARLAAAGAALLLVAACSSGDDAADAPAEAGAAVAPGATLLGVIGTEDDPDAYEISVTTEDGQPVTSVPAGDYTLVVDDQSSIHNFALEGDGVSVATSVPETGEESFEISLAAGEYDYVCDPHPNMAGTLTVT